MGNQTNGTWNYSWGDLNEFGIYNGSGQVHPISITVRDAIGNTVTHTGLVQVNNIDPTVAITSL